MYKSNAKILEKVRADLEETGYADICNMIRGQLFPTFMTKSGEVLCPDRYSENRICKIECNPNESSRKVSRNELKFIYSVVIEYEKENGYPEEHIEKLKREMEFLGLSL